MTPDIVFTQAGTGFMYWGPGDSYTVLIDGQRSGGSYFVLEALVPPGGGPPPHIHHREDEAFYLLQGTLTLTAGERKIAASAGDFVHIPRGTVHTFTNSGNGVAKMLAIFSPPGMEGWFAEAFDAAVDREATPPLPSQNMLARMARHAPKYGVEFV